MLISANPSARQPLRQPWPFERLVHARAVALGFAIDASTAKSYTSHLQSYLTFCKMHHFDIMLTADTLSFYTVYMYHHIKPSSVDSYLSGICNQLESLYSDVRALRRHSLVTRTLAGCKRMLNTPPARKSALEPHHLLTLLHAFPPTSHDNRLFRTLLLSGFFGLHRLCELVWPDDAGLRSWRKVIARASVSFAESSYGYLLPAHKADRFFDGSRVLIDDCFAPAGVVPSHEFRVYLASWGYQLPAATCSVAHRRWYRSLAPLVHDSLAQRDPRP